jgi:glutathione transport system substrate-binding protein
MMKRKKGIKLLFLALLSIAIITGCSSNETGGENSENASQKEEMVIAVNENFISMDPHNTGDTNSNSVQSSMLEGLLGIDPEGKIIPLLAEEYSVSEDALEYTFKLRKEVKFHDGTPFNAEAVKVNFERIMNPDNNLRLNSRGFNLIEGIEIVSEHELKVKLSAPYSGMLTRFASAKLISPELIKDGNQDISKNPIGTGPYKFVEWVQGDHLTVEKFEDYWGGNDRVKKITYKPVPENGSRVAMLKTGEADVIYPLPVQNVKELESDKNVEVKKIPSVIARYVSINTTKEPFNDVKVRQALNYAVNKDAFIKVVNSGFGKPLDSIIPSKTIYYAQQQSYDYNIEKAKDLLKEAGYPDGFKAEIWGNTNSDTMKGMQFIQQQLKEIGVELEIKSMEEGTLSEEIYGPQTPEEAKVQMWYVSWSAYPSDITNATKPLFSSESFPPNGANTAYYKNDKVDQLFTKANATSDENKQKEIYGDIQSTIYQDAPWIFLGVDEIVAGFRSNVVGVEIAPSGDIMVRDANFN